MKYARPSRIALVTFVLGSCLPAFAYEKFVDPLPIPPVLNLQGKGTVDLVMKLSQFKARFHRDLPETDVWGYNGSSPGPTVVVDRNQTIRVHWKNDLPLHHLIPGTDMSTLMPGMGSQVLPEVRAVTHLHGAVVAEAEPMNRVRNDDGWPDAWTVPGESQLAEYGNPQEARALWYHDHAMASTARSVYAGLFGMYLIRDEYEKSLNLPSGKFEIPLIIAARAFDDLGALFYPKVIKADFYGNTLPVNGKIWPYLNVEPRKYRFRILNASNARSIELSLEDAGDQTPGPAFHQIGSDSGFLEKPAELGLVNLAPAERADVILDFSKFGGKELLLRNSSLTDAGEGELLIPQVMLFKVATQVSEPDKSVLPVALRPIPRLDPAQISATRRIVLSQTEMADGTPMMWLNGKLWNDPIEEKPILGTSEIWEIVDTLPDLHPFHMHLVDFQVLDRRPFDVDAFTASGQMIYTDLPIEPEPGEKGWKDTVRALPGTVTRIIMRFAPFTGYYVYHCHILEHEDMGMMRPFQVVAP